MNDNINGQKQILTGNVTSDKPMYSAEHSTRLVILKALVASMDPNDQARINTAVAQIEATMAGIDNDLACIILALASAPYAAQP